MWEISNVHLRILRTVLLYLAMICLGMCTAIPGPTLLDLQRLLQSETDKISTLYIGRSVGYLLGSFLGGVLLDYLKRPQLLLFLFILIMSLCTIIIPWCRNLQSLIGIMAFSGSAMGAMDTGLNVWCLDLWNDENSPYFQALHFFFGLGAFFAPIIAGPFLSQSQQNASSNWTLALQKNSSLETFDSHLSDYNTSNVTYIYVIIGSISLFVSILFSFLFLTRVKLDSHKEQLQYKDPKQLLRIIIIICAFLLLSVYAGIEIGFGQMIAVYAVKSDHKFSESSASYITSLFWGTFTFSRGLSIFLSLRFSPLVIVLCDCTVMLSASIIFILLGHDYETFLWLGSALLGLGLASFYPSTITWVERHVNVNNKIGSGFVVAASLGEMIAPLTVSQFVNTTPEFLFYATITSVVVCAILIFILWSVTSYAGLKKAIKSETFLNPELSDLAAEVPEHQNSEMFKLASENQIKEHSEQPH